MTMILSRGLAASTAAWMDSPGLTTCVAARAAAGAHSVAAPSARAPRHPDQLTEVPLSPAEVVAAARGVSAAPGRSQADGAAPHAAGLVRRPAATRPARRAGPRRRLRRGVGAAP